MKINKDQSKQIATIFTAVASMLFASGMAAYIEKHLLTTTQFIGTMVMVASLYLQAIIVLGANRNESSNVI